MDFNYLELIVSGFVALGWILFLSGISIFQRDLNDLADDSLAGRENNAELNMAWFFLFFSAVYLVVHLALSLTGQFRKWNLLVMSLVIIPISYFLGIVNRSFSSPSDNSDQFNLVSAGGLFFLLSYFVVLIYLSVDHAEPEFLNGVFDNEKSPENTEVEA